jgi:cellulose synthase (UDP-forming)
VAGRKIRKRRDDRRSAVPRHPSSLASQIRHPFAPPPVEQHDVPWRDFQQATKFGVVLGLGAAAFYLTFIYDRTHENVPFLWVMTVIAESIVVLHTIGIWITLVSYRSDIPESEELAVIRRALVIAEIETPDTDVFICCAGEPLDMIVKTALAAQEMHLPHNTWILDDGRDDDLRDAAERMGVGYLRRETNEHAKAGNVNSAIARTTGRFIVVLDADHVPRPDFLTQTLPHLIANPSIAMVQTPQTYATAGRGMVAEGAAVSQELFYEAIMPAKNASNAAFCVGTNVVYRRSALKSLTEREPEGRERLRQLGTAREHAPRVTTKLGEHYPEGGIWVGSNSEDIWTSLELHRRGWRTVFLPKVLTQGLTPDRLGAFFKQQFRWACGGWEIALRAGVLRERRLTLSQKIQYLLVPSHYMLSFATCIFVFLSPIYLLADWSPISAPFWTWAIHYVPFYALTIAVPFLQAGKIRMSAIIVSMAAAPAHVRAFFMTALRQKAGWSVTNGKQKGFQLRTVLPHLFVGLLCLISLIVGWSLEGRNPTSTLLASFFVTCQLVIVIALIIGAERSDRLARKAEAQEPSVEESLAMLDDYLAQRSWRSDRVPVRR